MDPRRLKIFLKLLETRSFSKTADFLGLTQPSVSASLKSLEESLGQRLFERTPRAVKPLPTALILAPFANTIVEAAGQAAWAVGRHQANTREKLTLGASAVPATVYLPPALALFNDAYPRVLIRLKTEASKIVAQKVAGGELELGLVGGVPEQDDLSRVFIAQDRLTLLASRTLAEKIGPPPQSLDDLWSWPLIMYEEGSGPGGDFFPRPPGNGEELPDRLNIRAEVEGLTTCLALVRASFGAAIVSSRLPPLLGREDLVSMPLPFFGGRRMFVIQRRVRKISPAATALINILKQLNRQ